MRLLFSFVFCFNFERTFSNLLSLHFRQDLLLNLGRFYFLIRLVLIDFKWNSAARTLRGFESSSITLSIVSMLKPSFNPFYQTLLMEKMITLRLDQDLFILEIVDAYWTSGDFVPNRSTSFPRFNFYKLCGNSLVKSSIFRTWTLYLRRPHLIVTVPR